MDQSGGTRILEGRVRRAGDGQSGVAGVRVEAWATLKDRDVLVGSSLARADGRYRIIIEPESASREKDLSVTMTVVDRHGSRIHTTATRRRIRGDKPVTIDVDLRDETLTHHFAEPLTFEHADHLVDRAGMGAEIDAALALIAPPGDPQYTRMRRAAYCPPIDFDLLDQLSRDALDVLEGDPIAGRRFASTLDIIKLTSRPDEVMEPDSVVDPHHTGMASAGEAMGNSHGHGSSDSARTVPISRAVPIMAAAAYIDSSVLGGGGHLPRVVGRLCHVESFGVLHRAAMVALRGDGIEQFRGLLTLRGGGGCGPDDRPLPGPEHQLPCDPGHVECARDVANALQNVPTFTIADVIPARACPGESILIRGWGFTDRSGRVAFRRRETGDWIDVRPDSWSDTRITVRVPDDAGCELKLTVFDRTERICDRFIDIYRRPIKLADFGGTAPEIKTFLANGRGESCLLPGAALSLRWETCGADQVEVTLIDDGGVVLASNTSAPADGTLAYVIPTGDSTRRLRARIRALGRCRPPVVEREIQLWVHRSPRLSVQGMEVTQSIQYYQAAQHLTQAIDRGADNSLQIVTGKSAWVRVYVRSGQDPSWDNGQLTRVIGTLTVDRIVGGRPIRVFVLAPQAPGVVVAEANPPYAIERGTLNATLNFVIPAAEMTGRLRLTADLSSQDAHCGGGTATFQTTVDVNLTQTLQVAAVVVGYNGPNPAGGPNLVLPAPTLTQVNATLPYTLATYPVAAAFSSRLAGTLTLGVPLNDAPSCAGCCTPNWGILMGLVQAAATSDGNQANWLYYGMLAAAIPQGAVIGCGTGGGVGTGFVTDGLTMAHEIGHQLGRPHAPCGNPGVTDPSYPAYEPYDPPNTPTATLGEYGLDIRDGTIHPPTERDFMSYCAQWISIYGLQVVTSQTNLQPTVVPVGAGVGRGVPVGRTKNPGEIAPMDMISVIGQVDDDHLYRVTSVARTTTRPVVLGGSATGIVVELLDGSGQRLSSARLHVTAPTAAGGDCGCGGGLEGARRPCTFQALVPYVPEGQMLRIREKDDVLWSKKAWAKPPKLKLKRCQLDKNGRIEMQWSATVDPEAETDYWVQWSPDAGKTWRGLAVGVKGAAYSFDASDLPSGPVAFRLLLHDGFSTVTADSRPVTLPARPPTVTILHPEPGTEVAARSSLLLWGRAVDSRGHALPEDSLTWFLNGVEVGTGSEVRLLPPTTKVRRQVARLLARDAQGEAQASVSFEIDPQDVTE